MLNIKKTRKLRLQITKKQLITEYIVNSKSLEETANFLKCSKDTIIHRMKYYNITPRKPGFIIGSKFKKEHKEKISKALLDKPKSNEHKQSIKDNHADFSGKNNPMYATQSPMKGRFGEESSNYKDGRCVKFKAWHTAVLERDNHTCQICGKTDKEVRLDCHHIKPKKDFPEFVYDIDYGITLCVHCHPKYENKAEFLLKIIRSES